MHDKPEDRQRDRNVEAEAVGVVDEFARRRARQQRARQRQGSEPAGDDLEPEALGIGGNRKLEGEGPEPLEHAPATCRAGRKPAREPVRSDRALPDFALPIGVHLDGDRHIVRLAREAEAARDDPAEHGSRAIDASAAGQHQPAVDVMPFAQRARHVGIGAPEHARE